MSKDFGDIYVITSPSGKQYVGQCVQYLSNGKKWGYLNRYASHIKDALKGKDYCRLLNNAIRKYGPDNMKIERIITCKVEEMDTFERQYIEEYKTLTPNGYNLTTGGESCSRQSEETKERRRQSMIGKNVGKVYEKRKRKREEDSNLPKYIRFYLDKSGKTGYRISHHPELKDRSFVSKYLSMEQKLKDAINYLNTSQK